jgi:hypothetical protein
MVADITSSLRNSFLILTAHLNLLATVLCRDWTYFVSDRRRVLSQGCFLIVDVPAPAEAFAYFHRQSCSQFIVQKNIFELKCMQCEIQTHSGSSPYDEQVLHRVKKERNIVHTIKRKKADWMGRIPCRNCHLSDVIVEETEGKIDVTGSRGRRRKQLLDDLKDSRWYCKLTGEALDPTL